MRIYCCGCETNIEARLTDGREIYPHRIDLSELPFWKCDDCNNYVGCHHKTKDRTNPLGCIPTKEIRSARGHIHKLVDPYWRSKLISRQKLYKAISDAIGFEFHSANIRTIEEARDIYRKAREVCRQIQ